ncbi:MULTISPECIES: Cof-type HAD-IIB family hydrolase [unclassified Lysinibacillus]|uniref:Cof-type HAD-IIB family hydrolase n=1 Tax=unclassified Lysinibacillus TaxID=2636778 RepID=UPI0020122F58|nr:MULTISPECIES: Cof-type HAD-IIB family hydrolase [unclassified Lysinibacillus]MCL1695660.1 Cof-type HAD-IIB family hydrolase [Lysinibacillus sp. BPa_S21]MCL1700095.1 Cof-type HAD-IIB family hydrolase [Lysinibacillus sp. Bpr_S20]
MNKILFFDVDGTLYNSEKRLPASAKEALFEARRNGYELAIATGRAPFMIQSLLEELDIDTYITFNGQYVVYKGEVVYTNGIEKDELTKIIAFAAARNEPVVFLDDQRMIASGGNNAWVAESLNTLKYPYPEIDSTYYMQNSVYQTLIFMEEKDEPMYREAFPNVQFVRWHRYSCDILPKGGSKAAGIEKVLERMGLTIEDAIAFGDGMNDIEMLQAVGTGVAMGNGHERVKAVATHIAEHVDEDGLAKIMRQLNII